MKPAVTSGIICSILLSGCSLSHLVTRSINIAENDLKDHVGFYLVDSKTKRVLADYNGSKYFTPASNTKIFTFYTSLRLIKDSVYSISYQTRKDSLIFWGMGDPSLLYPACYQNGLTYQFLKNVIGNLYFSHSNFNTLPLGPGWAWDDYPYSYSAERSEMPIFGNLLTIQKDKETFRTNPPRFLEHLLHSPETHLEEEILRDLGSNELIHFPGKQKDTRWTIPFHVSGDLIADLLSDTLKRVVEEVRIPYSKETEKLKSIPADSLYKVMMQDSDNFIAEQLLLQCSAILSDTLKPEIAIEFAQKNYLNDLPDKPRWVDGSGLSRYNLFTPRSIVKLWEKIQDLVPRDRLFSLLATGGKSGTLKNYYQSVSPYVFGKTGTLSNNHCLSGFLLTEKGKTFIFSYMNNNYVASEKEVRKHMEKLLKAIHDKY